VQLYVFCCLLNTNGMSHLKIVEQLHTFIFRNRLIVSYLNLRL